MNDLQLFEQFILEHNHKARLWKQWQEQADRFNAEQPPELPKDAGLDGLDDFITQVYKVA